MPPKSVGKFFFNASCREDTGVTLLIWRFRSGQQLTSNWEEIHGFPSSHIDGHCIVLAWRQDHSQTLPVWIIVHLNHRRTIVGLSAVITQDCWIRSAINYICGSTRINDHFHLDIVDFDFHHWDFGLISSVQVYVLIVTTARGVILYVSHLKELGLPVFLSSLRSVVFCWC